MIAHRAGVRRTPRGLLTAGVAGLIAIIAVAASTQASDTADFQQVQANTPQQLVSAIEDANADSSTAVQIELQAGASYEFTSSYVGTSTALPPIASEITIIGNGATISRGVLREGILFRLFEVDQGGDLELQNVTVTNGRVAGNGGGILNRGSLSVVDSEVSGNEVIPDDGVSLGGGIAGDLRSTTAISDSLIEDNTATDGRGGGIHISGLPDIPTQASLTDSTVRSNRAHVHGGGISLWAELHVNNSTVEQNQAGESGGGISLELDAWLDMVDSGIYGNTAGENGGGIAGLEVSDSADSFIELFGVEIDNNHAGEPGGGIYSDGQLVAAQSKISNNTAASGGGIFARPVNAEPMFDDIHVELVEVELSGNSATLDPGGMGGGLSISLGGVQISDSHVFDNSAERYGGGLMFGAGTHCLLETSTIRENSGNHGGGIHVGGNHAQWSDMTFENITVHGNDASNVAGGIFVFIFASLELNHVTVTGNSSTIFGGGGLSKTQLNETDTTTVSIGNSVVAQNSSTQTSIDDVRIAVDGALIDNGHNLVGDGTGAEDDLLDGVNGNQVGTAEDPLDPELGPLQDNGGSTLTRLPEVGSPLIDAADPANAPNADQRGVNRPIGDGPDIGSVERDTTGDPAPPPPPDDDDDTDSPGLFNLPDNISVEAMSAAGAIVDYPAPTANDIDGSSLEVTCEPAPGSWFPVGQTAVQCSATDSDGQTHSGGFQVSVGEFDSLDISHADHISNQFFERNWRRTDSVVRDGHASRTWMWSPGPFTDSMWEPYATPGGNEAALLDQIPETEREVIYFDKARMEINDPDGDPDSLWYVTNGLLVVEMITGERQFGDDLFIQYEPSHANVAGDGDGLTGPTYAAMADLMDAPPQTTGTLLTQEVDRYGNVTDDASWGAHNVHIAFEDDVTGHGIAEPFWDFMNSHGLVEEDGQLVEDALFENPFYATGRPVTGAYWAEVQVGGEPRDVLTQCLERRCLTYTPGNPEGFVVEAGNVGQHYYDWRYIQAPD